MAEFPFPNSLRMREKKETIGYQALCPPEIPGANREFPADSFKLPLSRSVENLMMSRLPDKINTGHFKLLQRLLVMRKNTAATEGELDQFPYFAPAFQEGTQFRMYTLPRETLIVHADELFRMIFEEPGHSHLSPWHLLTTFVAMGWVGYVQSVSPLIAHLFHPTPDAVKPNDQQLNELARQYLQQPELCEWLLDPQEQKLCDEDPSYRGFILFFTYALKAIQFGFPLSIYESQDHSEEEEEENPRNEESGQQV